MAGSDSKMASGRHWDMNWPYLLCRHPLEIGRLLCKATSSYSKDFCSLKREMISQLPALILAELWPVLSPSGCLCSLWFILLRILSLKKSLYHTCYFSVESGLPGLISASRNPVLNILHRKRYFKIREDALPSSRQFAPEFMSLLNRWSCFMGINIKTLCSDRDTYLWQGSSDPLLLQVV